MKMLTNGHGAAQQRFSGNAQEYKASQNQNECHRDLPFFKTDLRSATLSFGWQQLSKHALFSTSKVTKELFRIPNALYVAKLLRVQV